MLATDWDGSLTHAAIISSFVMLVITDNIAVPIAEFRLTFSRSSGPGGQNVNKVNSKVTLHWDVTATASLPEDVKRRLLAKYHQQINVNGQLVIASQRYRDQLRNRMDCLEKLRQMVLGVATPPKRRRPTRPSRAARERRMRAKRQQSEKKRMRRPPPE